MPRPRRSLEEHRLYERTRKASWRRGVRAVRAPMSLPLVPVQTPPRELVVPEPAAIRLNGSSQQALDRVLVRRH